MTFLTDYYLWIKSLHVISVVAWMAGLFYLPRLFVYHAESNDPALHDTFVVMERRLLNAIMTPAAISTWVFGILLVLTPRVVEWNLTWPWTKGVSVIILTLFHFWLSSCRKRLASGENRLSGRTYRIMNEVPTIFVIVIVFSVIVKF